MRKRYSFDRLFEGNKFVLICVFFTVLVLFSAIGNAIAGVRIYLSIGFVVSNIFYVSAPVLIFAIFQYLWKSDYIAERDYLLWVGIPLHYLLSLGLILFFTFIHGLFEPLAQGIYLFRFRDFTALYIIGTIGAIAIDFIRTAKDNKNLRKVQRNQSNIKNRKE